jgi:hypothetical protein
MNSIRQNISIQQWIAVAYKTAQQAQTEALVLSDFDGHQRRAKSRYDELHEEVKTITCSYGFHEGTIFAFKKPKHLYLFQKGSKPPHLRAISI